MSHEKRKCYEKRKCHMKKENVTSKKKMSHQKKKSLKKKTVLVILESTSEKHEEKISRLSYTEYTFYFREG